MAGPRFTVLCFIFSEALVLMFEETHRHLDSGALPLASARPVRRSSSPLPGSLPPAASLPRVQPPRVSCPGGQQFAVDWFSVSCSGSSRCAHENVARLPEEPLAGHRLSGKSCFTLALSPRSAPSKGAPGATLPARPEPIPKPGGWSGKTRCRGVVWIHTFSRISDKF